MRFSDLLWIAGAIAILIVAGIAAYRSMHEHLARGQELEAFVLLGFLVALLVGPAWSAWQIFRQRRKRL